MDLSTLEVPACSGAIRYLLLCAVVLLPAPPSSRMEKRHQSSRLSNFYVYCRHNPACCSVRLSCGLTCNSLNLQRATFHNLHVPSERQHVNSKGNTKQLNRAAKEDDENTQQVVALSGSTPVAKHHWSEEMHRMIADGNGQYWTTPVAFIHCATLAQKGTA